MFRKLCVALVPVLLAVSGCASPKVNADDRATFNAALRKSRVVSTGADITLPFDSYFMSTPQANQFDRAAQILARDCMKHFGFDWRIRVTEVKVEVAPKAGRYGLIDADAAATYGYHATPDEADTGGDAGVKPDAATAMVYFGNGPSTYAGQTVPKGGCLGEARSKLAEGAPVSLSTQELRGLQNELYHKAQADRRVQAAMAGWRTCMKSAGYDYDDIWKANNDPRWTGPQPAPEEIPTAKADVTCKKRVDLAGIWLTVETAYELESIQQRAGAFDAVRKSLDVQVENAARVGGRS
jgi:hypothetical protein